MRGIPFLLSIVLVVFLLASFVAAEDWDLIDSGTDEPLFAVWFANEQEGWAVGGPSIGMPTFPSATILHSTDSGLTWEAQDSPVAEQLFDVCFADANHGWAVGSGVILHTTNGGETWVDTTIPYETNFYDISCFANSNTAYVVGAIGDLSLQGSILKTTNGETWVVLDSNVQDTLLGSSFVDEEHGFVTSSGGHVLRTEDGENFEDLGITYSSSGIANGFNDIYCFSMDECWAAGSGEFAAHSTDGGENWEYSNSGFSVISLNSLGVKDEEHIWFTGQSTLRHTDDGGETWLIDDTDITVGSLELLDVAYMRDVMFVGNLGWAVGDDGVILRTGEATACEEIENWCEDNGYAYTTQYDEVTYCPIDYLCVVLDTENPSAMPVEEDEEEEESCQEEYRDCLEEEWPNIDSCDAWEFCDGLDEVVAEVEKGQKAKDIFDSAGQYKYFQNFLNGEQVNVYILQKDGSTESFGFSVIDKKFQIVDVYEEATIKVSLSQETVDRIQSAENRKKAALEAFNSGEIDVEGVGFKKIKMFFFKGGMKISLPFLKD